MQLYQRRLISLGDQKNYTCLDNDLNDLTAKCKQTIGIAKVLSLYSEAISRKGIKQ